MMTIKMMIIKMIIIIIKMMEGYPKCTVAQVEGYPTPYIFANAK